MRGKGAGGRPTAGAPRPARPPPPTRPRRPPPPTHPRPRPPASYVTTAVEVDPERPVLVDKYLDRRAARADALC